MEGGDEIAEFQASLTLMQDSSFKGHIGLWSFRLSKNLIICSVREGDGTDFSAIRYSLPLALGFGWDFKRDIIHL